MNYEILIMSITVIAAIAAPLFTAKIQAKSALRLKTIEVIYEKKIAAYRDFAVKYGATLGERSIVNIQEMFASTYTSMFYAGNNFSEPAAKLLRCYRHVGEYDTIDGEEYFLQCVKALSEDIQNMKPVYYGGKR